MTDVIDLEPMSECVAVNNPSGQWHTVEVMESGSVILECMDGAYELLGENDILSLLRLRGNG